MCWRRSSSRAAGGTGRPSTRASQRARSTSTSPATTTSAARPKSVRRRRSTAFTQAASSRGENGFVM